MKINQRRLILFQEEGGAYDDWDLEQLLGNIGIVGKGPCNAIIELHSRIKAVNSRATSVLELLQTASLVHQQLERGEHLTVAITEAAADVYLSGQRHFSLRQVNRQLSLINPSPEKCRGNLLFS